MSLERKLMQIVVLISIINARIVQLLLLLLINVQIYNKCNS